MRKQKGKVIIELPRIPANAWLFEPMKDESRMISLIQYDEFEKGMGFPGLKEAFNTDKYEAQEKIIEYMKKGETSMVLVSHDVDIVTGEVISNEKRFMNDGKYRWTSTLIYYVEKYNLRLPKEFEEYVASQ